MNVAETMRKVLPKLRHGLSGHSLPGLRPSCEEDMWNENYAIVQGLWYEYDPEDDYFHHDSFREDLQRRIRAEFPGCKVTFRWRSQEIEVEKLPEEPGVA